MRASPQLQEVDYSLGVHWALSELDISACCTGVGTPFVVGCYRCVGSDQRDEGVRSAKRSKIAICRGTGCFIGAIWLISAACHEHRHLQ